MLGLIIQLQLLDGFSTGHALEGCGSVNNQPAVEMIRFMLNYRGLKFMGLERKTFARKILGGNHTFGWAADLDMNAWQREAAFLNLRKTLSVFDLWVDKDLSILGIGGQADDK